MSSTTDTRRTNGQKLSIGRTHTPLYQFRAMADQAKENIHTEIVSIKDHTTYITNITHNNNLSLFITLITLYPWFFQPSNPGQQYLVHLFPSDKKHSSLFPSSHNIAIPHKPSFLIFITNLLLTNYVYYIFDHLT